MRKSALSKCAKPSLIAFLVLAIVGVMNECAFSSPSVELVRADASKIARKGDRLTITIALKLNEPVDKDCSLFVHLVGTKKGMFVNGDVSLPVPVQQWRVGETVTLGPFEVYVPSNLPCGRYRIEAGLFYTVMTLKRPVYVKLPYSNPTIVGWAIGMVTVVEDEQRARMEGKGYRVGTAHALEKVFPERHNFKGDLKGEISLSCARNETEGFQVVLIPGTEDLRDTSITVSDLVNEADNGVIKKENIRLYQVGYVVTRKPYYNTPRVGVWPDPLVPLRGTLNVRSGAVQPVWVSIQVPHDAPKGLYIGKCRVKPVSKEGKEITIALRVWDFTLPKETHLRTAFDFYEYLVDMRHPKRDGESDSEYAARMDRLRREYYIDMLNHRVSPIHNVGNPKFLGEKDGRYLLDFTEFDKKVDYYRTFGQNAFGIAQEWPFGWQGDWTDKWYGYTDAAALEGVFREYGMRLQEKGLLNYAYAYIFDETLHRVNEFTRLIHKGHPGIKNLVTMTPADGYPDVDIWCVRINNIERKAVAEFRLQGKEIWTYVAGTTRPYPNLNLDVPSLEYRIIPWICFKYKISGLLYWCANWWHNTNPWNDPMTYPEQNGNGSLYYPDPEGERPIGSIRLEVLRDGLEDYEYLILLETNLKRLMEHPKGREGEIAKVGEILKIPDEVVRTPGFYTVDPMSIYKLREEIASLIERTQ